MSARGSEGGRRGRRRVVANTAVALTFVVAACVTPAVRCAGEEVASAWYERALAAGINALTSGGRTPPANASLNAVEDVDEEVDADDAQVDTDAVLDEVGSSLVPGQRVSFGIAGPRVIGAAAAHEFMFKFRPRPWPPQEGDTPKTPRIMAQKPSTRLGKKAVPAIAGMYNTGTNAAFVQLNKNCQLAPWHWQMASGKHVAPTWTLPGVAPDDFKAEAMAYWRRVNFGGKEVNLPVVIVRHPLIWLLKSMCRKHYGATPLAHDPSFVLRNTSVCGNSIYRNPLRRVFDRKQDEACKADDALDRRSRMLARREALEGKGSRCFFGLNYKDPIDLWNDWYSAYTDLYDSVDFPVVFIRHEDLLLHPYEVTAKLCWAYQNVSLAPEEFVPNEKNVKVKVDGTNAQGHRPITGKDGKPVAASWYAHQVLDPSYVFSDQSGERLSEDELSYLASRVNQTLMEFFGYSMAREER